jgi:DNA repair protein RecO (recombination protein O)
MGPEKTQALILQLFPYRESSYILHTVTPGHGRVHGIAKGVRRNRKGDNFLERGFLIECFLYVKAQATLHTLGGIQIIDFFPATRTTLSTGALRDLAFEVVLAVVHDSDPHPGLFRLLYELAYALESTPEGPSPAALLWRFLIDLSGILGFRPDLDKCATCGAPMAGQGGRLDIRQGGIACPACMRRQGGTQNIAAPVRSWLGGHRSAAAAPPAVIPRDAVALTRLLTDYCRYHCDVTTELHSLAFLESTLWGSAQQPPGGH